MKYRFSPIKYFVGLLVCTSIFQTETSAQSCYNPAVDSIIAQISLQSVSMFNRELSGDTSTIIEGQPYTVISRHRLYTGNEKAGRYIYEKFLIGIINNQVPVSSSLSQNYPNPFNSSTRIKFSLIKKSHVKIMVYDVLGREVSILANNIYNSGEYNLNYNANNLASGLFFYTMFIDGYLFETKKMILVK
jgi:hypothetical protein